MMMKKLLLDVDDFGVMFFMCYGLVEVVCGILLLFVEGEIFGIVGESGFGKLVIGFVIMCLLDRLGWIL